MNLYELRQVYDRNTGKPAHLEPRLVGQLCDYCGKPIDPAAESDTPTFRVQESGDSEQQWYYYEMPEHPEVDPHKIFMEHDDYVYCLDFETEESCCQRLIADAAASEQYLFAAMYEARLATVRRLLEGGTTAQELGIGIDD